MKVGGTAVTMGKRMMTAGLGGGGGAPPSPGGRKSGTDGFGLRLRCRDFFWVAAMRFRWRSMVARTLTLKQSRVVSPTMVFLRQTVMYGASS